MTAALSATLTKLSARLARRAGSDSTGATTGSTIPVNAKLDAEEEAAYAALAAQYAERVVQESGVSQGEAERLLGDAIEPYGRKFFLECHVNPPTISGIPLSWMLADMALTLISYLTLWHSIDALLVVPVILWVPEYFTYAAIKDRLRRQAMQKLLAGNSGI